MKEGYLTTGEARAILRMHQHTFERYCQRFGLMGEHIGRCTYYKSEDIERMKAAFDNKADILIAQLERLTGGKVRIEY